MHLPSIYVQKVIKGPSYEKRIERVTLAQVILVPIKGFFKALLLLRQQRAARS